MQKNKWSRKFDWIKTSEGIYIQQTRSESYNENRYISVGDIYFKFNKYLTGVTYSYINSLENIYKRDLLTGDGYSIVNMYNEYDIIDYAFKNTLIVDVASDVDINLNSQWFTINDVKLKPGHLVLLKNQKSEFENDVYYVTEQYFLKNYGFLSSREKSYRFNCGVKLGKNKDKQFFLINTGEDFPIIGEPKYFIEGKSFILKNKINYNLYNTSTSNVSKIIFTDYDLARKQLSDNYSLYNTINFQVNSGSTPSNYFSINYHHDFYNIRSSFDSGVTYTGLTSSILNFNTTYIPYNNVYNFNVDDNIKLNIKSGSTVLLSLETFIKNISSGYILLEEIIPKNIFTNLKGTYFEIENLSAAVDWVDAFNKLSLYTTYRDYFDVFVRQEIVDNSIYDVTISPKESSYNKYFDYDGLSFYVSGGTEGYKFSTLNQYVNYKLYDNLSLITGVTSGTTIFNNYLLNNLQYIYTDNNRIKIITSLTGITNIFKPYTYVDVVGSGSLTVRTLVYDVSEHEIVVEKPYSWNNITNLPQIVSIQNIGNLKIISDILYEVYMNDDFGWYSRKNDNERKYISKVYADILVSNKFIRDTITGILYENENNEFILKLYDLGSIIDNDDINADKNLYYSIVELIYVGVDRKTRLPIPLSINTGVTSDSSEWYVSGDNFSQNPTNPFRLPEFINTISGDTVNDENWGVLMGGIDDPLTGQGDSNYIGNYFDAGYNDVLPGPNSPPLLYSIVNGNYLEYVVTFSYLDFINYVDENIPTITYSYVGFTNYVAEDLAIVTYSYIGFINYVDVV